MRSLARFATAVLAAAFLASCGSTSSSPTAPTPTGAKVTAVAVSSAQSSASSFQLKATAQFSDGTSRDVTTGASWTSSNTAVATVSASGVVTVVTSGELDVNATYQSVTGSLHLLVTRVPVAAVTVTGAPTTGATSFQLTATARLSDGSTQDVTRSASWSSSDTAIATVSSTGYVTIVASGDVDLRATYQGVTGDARLTVAIPKTYALTGVVAEVAPHVQPIAGARVQIVGGGAGFTTSDANGVYSIAGLPAGRNIIEVTKDGYQTYDNEITVSADTQLQVNLFPTPPKDASGASATARCNDATWSWAQTKSDACTSNGGVAYFVCPGPFCTTSTSVGR